jgi:hypothetical protein
MTKILMRFAEKREKWRGVVLKLGCHKDYVDDILQDTYLKLHKKIEDGADLRYGKDDINELYVYTTIRSVVVDFQRKKSSLFKNVMEDDKLHYFLNKAGEDELDVEGLEAYQRLVSKVLQECNSWENENGEDGWYARNLFLSYITSDMSYTKLMEETGIHRLTIRRCVIDSLEKLRESLREDCEDYINKDYDLI